MGSGVHLLFIRAIWERAVRPGQCAPQFLVHRSAVDLREPRQCFRAQKQHCNGGAYVHLADALSGGLDQLCCCGARMLGSFSCSIRRKQMVRWLGSLRISCGHAWLSVLPLAERFTCDVRISPHSLSSFSVWVTRTEA